jgi:hypothetical protein
MVTLDLWRHIRPEFALAPAMEHGKGYRKSTTGLQAYCSKTKSFSFKLPIYRMMYMNIRGLIIRNKECVNRDARTHPTDDQLRALPAGTCLYEFHSSRKLNTHIMTFSKTCSVFVEENPQIHVCLYATRTQCHAFILQVRKLLTYLRTHSMVQDIIWKADSHSACQKISCFLYGTRRLITVFTKARHWTLSWASRV